MTTTTPPIPTTSPLVAEADPYEDATKVFLQDEHRRMTYGRRLAMWLLNNYGGIYGPEAHPDREAPSLEKAWAFFEHVTLQRHIIEEPPEHHATRGLDLGGDDGSGGGGRGSGLQRDKSRMFRMGERKMDRAEPGEYQIPTKLYPIFSTPLSQLGDFGLGFGIYFATVRDFAFLALICGLLSIPNIIYFASEEYSNGQEGIDLLLKGSAICTNRSWVPCINCTADEFNSGRGSYHVDRFQEAWGVKPAENGGFYLNVTDYLTWDMERDENGTVVPLERTETREVQLDRLINASIPEEYGIELSKDGGYILNGVNITDKLLDERNPATPEGIRTPLWCTYKGPADCYLDLYPLNFTKDFEGHDDEGYITLPNGVQEKLVGDVDFIRVGFAVKNNCDGATLNQGFINWGTLLVMIVGSFLIRVRNAKFEIKFDEDEQTASDYSIVVKNPPADAYDPEEWKQFFEHALQIDDKEKKSRDGHKVRVCTVDVDNELLIKYLLERRETLRLIEMALPPGTPMDSNSLEIEARKAEEDSPGGCVIFAELPKLVERLNDVESKIKSYFNAVKRPPTTKIYVTFETEDAQRTVLSNSSTGTYQARHNDTSAVPRHYLFRNKHVLKIREAHEPNTIRWQDLNATRESILYRKCGTTAATVVAMVIASYIVGAIYSQNLPIGASIVTSLFTTLFSKVAVFLMNCEKHYSETSRQAWLFAKVTLFNVFVTCGLLSVITPFEATLDKKADEGALGRSGLIPAVHALFFAQITTGPLLQLIDIPGNINRHFLAPRAKTQQQMNLLMRGTPVHLAVRYGDLMKFLYLTLWFCSIYPAGYFMGAFALIITYFVDRFSIMRSWARCPHVGAEISYFARKYFTPVAICLMSVFSAYYWSGFPYDNLCNVENATIPSYYYGNYDVINEGSSLDVLEKLNVGNNFLSEHSLSLKLYNIEKVQENVSITESSESFKYCDQDLRSYGQLSFPALPQWQPEGSEWMTEEQEEVVSTHGWSSLIVLILIVFAIAQTIGTQLHMFLTGGYTPRGEDQKINFSAVPSIECYIPQVSSDLIAYPLILCDSQALDSHLFSWHDAERTHSFYDVTRDVNLLLGTTDYPDVFATVKHWHLRGEETAVSEHQPAGRNPEQGISNMDESAQSLILAAASQEDEPIELEVVQNEEQVIHPDTMASVPVDGEQPKNDGESTLVPPDVTHEVDVDDFAENLVDVDLLAQNVCTKLKERPKTVAN